MKKIYIIILLSSCLIQGCGDDFLTLNDPNSVGSGLFYKNYQQFNQALNAAYDPLQWQGTYGQMIVFLNILTSDIAVAGSSATDQSSRLLQFDDFSITSDNNFIRIMWQNHFSGIYRANIVLQNLDLNPDVLSDAEKNEIEGQAKFLRALYYYNLVRIFGGVPVISDPNDFALPRTTAAEVYKNLIIPDLQSAVEMLPDHIPHRADKPAAIGLLADVYLTLASKVNAAEAAYQSEFNENELWQAAYDYSADIIDDYDFELNENYSDNFDEAVENNGSDREIIFGVEFMNFKNEQVSWPYGLEGNWLQAWQLPRQSFLFPNIDGWGFANPVKEFVDSYEEGDLRKEWDILSPQETIVFDTVSFIQPAAQPAGTTGSNTGYSFVKWARGNIRNINNDWSSSPIDVPVLRYAEILLIHAEAAFMLNKQEEAKESLNPVRVRAGLEPLDQVNREDVMEERKFELANEGNRWFDLTRRGEAYFLQKMNAGNFSSPGAELKGSLVSANHMLMPIPLSEIDASDVINVADQNPGY
jgi:hypothetical protein